MKKLIAQRPILYHGRDYRQGETLPAGDEAMTAAWLRAGSAAWESPPAEEEPQSGAPADGELPKERSSGKERKGRKS